MPWQLHRGQTESTVLLEEPETLDAELRQEEEALGKGGGRAGATGTNHVHRWVKAGEWGDWMRGSVEEGPNLGRREGTHGQQPRGL